MPRLCQKEETNLLDMGSCGDVDQVLVVFGVKGIGADEIVKRRIDLLQVPGVLENHWMEIDLCFRGNCGNILHDLLGERLVPGFDQKVKLIDEEVFVLANCNRRPPSVPSLVRGGPIQLCTQKTQENSFHIIKDKNLSEKIKLSVSQTVCQGCAVWENKI